MFYFGPGKVDTEQDCFLLIKLVILDGSHLLRITILYGRHKSIQLTVIPKSNVAVNHHILFSLNAPIGVAIAPGVQILINEITLKF